MKRIHPAVSLVFGSLVLGFALVAQAGDESSAVEKLEKEMRQAQKDNNVSWYEQHLAEGYIEGHSWGEWAPKSEVLKQARDKANKISKSEVTDMKVSTFGPKIAVAHYKFTYDATFEGTHRARSVICTDTWVSETGAWKMAAAHCSHVEGT